MILEVAGAHLSLQFSLLSIWDIPASCIYDFDEFSIESGEMHPDLSKNLQSFCMLMFWQLFYSTEHLHLPVALSYRSTRLETVCSPVVNYAMQILCPSTSHTNE